MVNNINNMMTSTFELAVQMSIGQAVLRLVDRMLWVIEKSAQWALPSSEISSEENGKTFGRVELVRPLPWILFLPGLLALRMIRFTINVTASVLGYPKLEPADMVRIVQKGRRRIRAIKMSGLKNMRQKKSPSVTKSLPLANEQGAMESEITSPTQLEHKRKFSEINESSSSESEDEPLITKIERLANQSNSDDDADFIPSADDTNTEETDSAESELDMSVTLSEAQDLQAESEEMEKILLNHINMLDRNELHTMKDDLKPELKINSLTPSSDIRQLELSCENDSAVENRFTVNEQDTAYYSPISWKSVSPELADTPEKQDDQIDIEVISPGKIGNGEVKEKEKQKNDSIHQSIEAGKMANGHINEKQKSMSQNSGSNKNHQKNKRGNHGNRKKK